MTKPRQVRAWEDHERATHTCPGKRCSAKVSNMLLACPTHWRALSVGTKAMVNATAGQSPTTPARREALAAARKDWGYPA